ncbi:hypothetical protein RRG08_029215 [Elysia crispata]|uniref:Uncharacterized protein n=1 Tax=Elysia crispata TaxID=231223 RepID=A0AAE1AJ11_9GAST|nr:hypothetical protein RRG08_029215 [Elysia crispata]
MEPDSKNKGESEHEIQSNVLQKRCRGDNIIREWKGEIGERRSFHRRTDTMRAVACEATLIGMAKVARKFSYKRRCQVSLPAPKRHSQQEAWATPAVNARSCRNPTPQSGFPGEDLEISPLKFDVEACKTWTCKGSTAGRDGR